MKKSILLTSILICLCIMGNAQNPIAKINYEEAEQAYSDKDYTTAIEKLNEAEQLLGGANPKTQYLRILIYDKKLDAQLFKDLEMAAKLTSSCADFLAKNANVQALEDKYVEVYKVAKKIEPYNVVEKDFADAKAGKTEAMLKLAHAYCYFEDYANEYKWYKLLADKGNGEAMMKICWAYLVPKFRQPVQRNLASYAEWKTKAESVMTSNEKTFFEGFLEPTQLDGLVQAAELGNGFAAARAVQKYGWQKDFSAGMEMGKKALKLGCPLAYRYMYDLYQFGYGVEKNSKIANDYLQKGIALGNTECMIELARIIEDEDAKQAFDLCTRAAEKGSTNAMVSLASMYQYGNSAVSKNYSQALQWMIKRADIEPGWARDVAEIYRDGKMGFKNYAKAVEWYAKMYNGGWNEEQAKAQIAKLYREGGYGIEQSEAKAQEWEAKKR